MKAGEEPRLDALSVDVHAVLRRSVASLYSHLVTRPTGRAVRLAIENQIGELPRPALSVVDLSSVAILDYSCADEVVAKLLMRDPEGDSGVFFILTGVQEHHLDPIEAVLDRHQLAVVGERAPGRFGLIGAGSDQEKELWARCEEVRCVPSTELVRFTSAAGERRVLERLVRRRLLFRDSEQGDLHALSNFLVGRSGTG
jgi:hypothetical protein